MSSASLLPCGNHCRFPALALWMDMIVARWWRWVHHSGREVSPDLFTRHRTRASWVALNPYCQSVFSSGEHFWTFGTNTRFINQFPATNAMRHPSSCFRGRMCWDYMLGGGTEVYHGCKYYVPHASLWLSFSRRRWINLPCALLRLVVRPSLPSEHGLWVIDA